MTAYNLIGDNPTDLPKRAIRALTEKMTVLPNTGRVKDATDLYLVVSESGSEYLVDTRKGTCDCPDARHNLDADDLCKHERRVHYATGETLIPEWAYANAIDPQLGLHTTGNPVRAATDGGINTTTRQDVGESARLHEVNNKECACDDLHDDFPCWPCVRTERRELPE